MESKYVKPFIEATVKVLETMAFVKPTVGETCVWDHEKAISEVMGIIGFSNEEENIKGFMTVGFVEPSIVQIVSSMFGETFESMTEEVREAVGEIANMISGQARQGLSVMGLKLEGGLPTIITGKGLDINDTEDKPVWMVRFEVENGPFELGICIEGLPE